MNRPVEQHPEAHVLAKDAAIVAARAAISATPIVGGAILEIISPLLKTSWTRRAEELVASALDRIGAIESRFDTWEPKKLIDDEAFVAAVSRTVVIASI
jgi:hypothetical protein